MSKSSSSRHNRALAPVVKLVDTSDLKSAAFVNNGRAGSIPARGTTDLK